MMVDNEDLGLSLSLSCSKIDSNHTTSNGNNRLQLNLMAPSLFGSSSSSSSSSSSLALATLQKNRWLESFPNSSVDRIAEPTCRALVVSDPMSFLRGIDVNRAPASAGDDDEPGASSPNSTISSVSGKRSEREIVVVGDDLDGDRGCTDEEDGDTSRKKLRLSKDQSAVLEESFKEHNTLNPKQKMALAKRLGLRPRQVEVWFQNRRARTKLKQTEVDCEFLKRCCEQLTDDNRRLQKEVQELRALKLSPQFYMQMTPPTTLTMCPSCERVGVPPSSGSAAPTRFPVNPFRSYEGLRTRP